MSLPASRPFLYLHGFASSPCSQKARFFRDRLAERGFQLQVPDLAPGDFEHLTITGQLAVLTAAARGRPVALIGSSLGGYLAALYAARHPEVQALILLAPAFGFARRWQEFLGPRMAEWKRSGFLEVYHYGEHCNRQIAYGLFEDALRYEEYPLITQPTLVFHGKNDQTVPAVYSEQFATQRPNVQLSLLDSGHELVDVLPQIWEQAGPFLLRCVE